MKKRNHGPSLYYATDKNVFDALNQSKVDISTIMKLFERRNIIVGKRTPREDLARYFSRLTHDYFDHKDIADRLGVAPRRERITSMDVKGNEDTETISIAISQLKEELEGTGDVIQVSRQGESLTLNIQYSIVDYRRSEFSQVQVRDGTIELEKTDEGYVVRNTQNEYLNDVRDTLLGKIEKISDTPLTKTVVSLFDIQSPKLRSKFFHDLMNNLPGYRWMDVTDVYVYKPKPEIETSDENGNEEIIEDDLETHIERVSLRGKGVTRSEILNSLLDEDGYYITKIGWTAKENSGLGDVYDIEATFSDPKNCTGFSYILSGVFPFEDGKISQRKRAPTKSEIDSISRVIESKSRDLVAKLQEAHTMPKEKE